MEQAKLDSPSSLFSGITVNYVSLPAQSQTIVALYTVPPPTSTIQRVELQSLVVPRNKFVFFVFNLLPTSFIDVSWRLDGGALSSSGFFVFVGESVFDAWKHPDPDDDGYSASRRPYHHSVGFDGTYRYTFESATDVFFVWENPHDNQVQGSANFSISAIQYDWQNVTAEVTCRLYPCHLDLTGGKCVIMAGLDTNQTNNMRTISYRNIGRVGIYFGIAFGVPAGLLVACVLVCVVYQWRYKRSRYTSIGDDRPWRTVPQYSPPTYESVAVTPGAEPTPPAQSPEFDDGPTPSAPPA